MKPDGVLSLTRQAARSEIFNYNFVWNKTRRIQCARRAATMDGR